MLNESSVELRSDIVVDVGRQAVGANGDDRRDGRRHGGPGVAPPRWCLFCVPGGSYGRRYFDRHVLGRTGYSFAEHLAAMGR